MPHTMRPEAMPSSAHTSAAYWYVRRRNAIHTYKGLIKTSNTAIWKGYEGGERLVRGKYWLRLRLRMRNHTHPRR